MALLQETFPGRVISRRGDISWPPRSYDLKLTRANMALLQETAPERLI